MDQRSDWPEVKQPMNPVAMTIDKLKEPATDGPFIELGVNALASVEPEDLSRFEGEGGHEAQIPERVDIA
jgi:hypothetical protein